MSDDISDSTLDMFLEEAGLMLTDFEQALLAMASASSDIETLNSAFRAAHNIKGTAGMFGFDRVVEFTHEVEALLDRMRAGSQDINETAVELLLQCLDQIQRLLGELSEPEQMAPNAERSRHLMQQLAALKKGGSAPPPVAAEKASPTVMPTAPTQVPEWLIWVRFGTDTLRDGYDPLSFLRYLDQVGTIQQVAPLTDHIPTLVELDAQGCQMGFALRLQSTASAKTIRDAFAFVADSCTLKVVPAPFSVATLQAELQSIEKDSPRVEHVLREIGVWPSAPNSRTDLPPIPHNATEDDLESLFNSIQQGQTPTTSVAPPSNPSVPQPKQTPAAPVIPATPPAAADHTPTKAQRKKPAAREKKPEESRYIRVPADKLDDLISQIGELVIAVSSAQIVAERHNIPEFSEIAQRLDKLVEGARDHSLRLRMVPVGETFSRFKRIVFDVSRTLGKEAELIITGGDTELDKSMVEQLIDPLTHLVRNALDHGLEAKEERLAQGKHPCGQIRLNAYHDAGAFVIEVSDDGRGLARERILSKAIERKLIPADSKLADEQVWNLVFLPGFSTAEQVTDLSGRGVGMDVVKRNIEALRGEVNLFSEPGAGSMVQIRLPLTLAIIDGFLVEVAGSHFVLPLDGVEECIAMPDLACPHPNAANYFELRNTVIPLLCLRRHFRLNAAPPRRYSVVIVRHGSQRVGLLVDRLHGEHQTVIKPLGRLFNRVRSISGSTILGSGSVALILDIAALLADASTLHTPTAPSISQSNPLSSHAE